MSCSCTHIDNWNPCSCGCNSIVTTSTTTTTTTCDGEKCEVALDPNCIIYCGPDIPCYGIQTGDTAADIMQIILNSLCTTTSTT